MKKPIKRILVIIIITVLVAFAGFCLLLYISQAGLIYYPSPDIFTTPDKIGLEYEDAHFQTADSTKLHGWFIPADSARGIVLFCHGNAGNISHRFESIEIFHELGLSVFIFDYRGYGKSDGKPTEKGTYLDSEAALEYIIDNWHIAPSEIIYFGRSLGGAIASWLAVEHPPKMLIIESAFTSTADLGSEIYPFVPVKLLLRFKYKTIENLRKINCPVLVIHSRDDDIIPFEHGQKLFEAANEPKRFLEIFGTHNNGFSISGTVYQKGLEEFINQYIAN